MIESSRMCRRRVRASGCERSRTLRSSVRRQTFDALRPSGLLSNSTSDFKPLKHRNSKSDRGFSLEIEKSSKGREESREERRSNRPRGSSEVPS